jgi:uncharacterized membrane protein YhaH (DUF805 family)
VELILLTVLLFCGVIYLLPAIIAFRRKHPNRFVIAVLNTMTGLTLVGWYFTLRAALSVTAPVAGPSGHSSGSLPINERTNLAMPVVAASQSNVQTQRRGKMGFFKSIGTCFGKYAVFSGRASRSEFWWFFLFSFLLLAVTSPVPALAGLAILVLFFPLFAVGIRRLHDIGKSGWFCLLYPIPIIGLILYLVWNCRGGEPEANRFGPNPLVIP